MKLSDYVAQFLASNGVRHVFAVSGGASLHLIHSINDARGITYICPQHEQAGAMAADGYARVTRNFGAAISTSGPGATNMVTGICGAYYDSIPVIYITGQVATFRFKDDTGVRQIGFQETDIIDICKPITKYAVQIKDPGRIRYELEKACQIAKEGRPGPVLIDIPDNIQRMQVDPKKMVSYTPRKAITHTKKLVDQIKNCARLISKAKRPILIVGDGVRLAGADKELIELIDKLGFPVVPTWAAADILPSDHPLMVGTFGTHGTRYANFAVQNSDLVIAIGSRLDTKATGSPAATFARGAKKIMIDIDPCELMKFRRYGLHMDLLIRADAKEFIRRLNKTKIVRNNISGWIRRIYDWKRKYPICPKINYKSRDINPYVFVKRLSESLETNESIFVDTGCTLAWMLQAFDFKVGQRMYHDWNNTAMGWALPASIGGAFAVKGKRVICVTGDGSLQMNIQELATIIRHKLPIKIFLINNLGYSMIQQTQDQWMDSTYLASTIKGGLAFPDFIKLAKAYGFKTVDIRRNKDLSVKIKKALSIAGPVFCNVNISGRYKVVPQVKFGKPNEDPEPLLDRSEFLRNMIVTPLPASLNNRMKGKDNG